MIKPHVRSDYVMMRDFNIVSIALAAFETQYLFFVLTNDLNDLAEIIFFGDVYALVTICTNKELGHWPSTTKSIVLQRGNDVATT